eukprot:g6333.t1
MSRKGTPIHDAQAMLSKAHLLTVEQLNYMIGALGTTRECAVAREAQYTHHSQIPDAPLSRHIVFYKDLGFADAGKVIGSAGQLATRSISDKLKKEGSVKQIFFEIWGSDEKSLPLGRLNVATLKATVDELREAFRPFQLVEIVTKFTFVSADEKLAEEKKKMREELDATNAAFLRNFMQNSMNMGMNANPMFALMGPGMSMDPVEAAKAAAFAQAREEAFTQAEAAKTASAAPAERAYDTTRHTNFDLIEEANKKSTLVFTPLDGGGVAPRHVPVVAPAFHVTPGGASSTQRNVPAAQDTNDDHEITFPDMPGMVGKWTADGKITVVDKDEDSDAASLFGRGARKVVSKEMAAAAYAAGAVAMEDEDEMVEVEVVKKNKKRKGQSPNAKAMKTSEVVEVPAMKTMKKK